LERSAEVIILTVFYLFLLLFVLRCTKRVHRTSLQWRKNCGLYFLSFFFPLFYLCLLFSLRMYKRHSASSAHHTRKAGASAIISIASGGFVNYRLSAVVNKEGRGQYLASYCQAWANVVGSASLASYLEAHCCLSLMRFVDVRLVPLVH